MKLTVTPVFRDLYAADCAEYFRETFKSPHVYGASRYYYAYPSGSGHIDAPGIYYDGPHGLYRADLYSRNLELIKYGGPVYAFSQSCDVLINDLDQHISDNDLKYGFTGFYHPDVVVVAGHSCLHPLARQQQNGISGSFLYRGDDEPEQEVACVWIDKSLDKAGRLAAAQRAERVLETMAKEFEDDDDVEQGAPPPSLVVTVPIAWVN